LEYTDAFSEIVINCNAEGRALAIAGDRQSPNFAMLRRQNNSRRRQAKRCKQEDPGEKNV